MTDFIPVRRCVIGDTECFVIDETRMTRDQFRVLTSKFYIAEMLIPKPIEDALKAGRLDVYADLMQDVPCIEPATTLLTSALTVYGRYAHGLQELLDHAQVALQKLRGEAKVRRTARPALVCPWCVFTCRCDEFELGMKPLCDLLPLNPLHAQ